MLLCGGDQEYDRKNIHLLKVNHIFNQASNVMLVVPLVSSSKHRNVMIGPVYSTLCHVEKWVIIFKYSNILTIINIEGVFWIILVEKLSLTNINSCPTVDC